MLSSRQLFRYARDGFKNVCNHIFMSFSSVLTLIITLSFCSLFVLFAANTNQFTRDIESEVTLFAEFRDEVTEAQINDVIERMSTHELVKDAEFRPRDEEHENIAGIIADGNDTLEEFLLDGQDNPLPHALLVEVYDIEDIEPVRNFMETELPAIAWISDPSAIAGNLMSATSTIRNVMVALVVILMVLAIFLIQNTIKLTIYSRQEELHIMKLVGASVGHITIPFVVEGLIIGIVGSIIPILFTLFGYRMLYAATSGVFAIDLLQLANPVPLVYQIGFITGLISIVVSLVGSLVAVGRYALRS